MLIILMSCGKLNNSSTQSTINDYTTTLTIPSNDDQTTKNAMKLQT